MKVIGTTLTLSRRNLLTLLAKLDGHPRDSECALYREGWIVKAEDDAVHYLGRKPGPMHPDTEKEIRRKR